MTRRGHFFAQGFPQFCGHYDEWLAERGESVAILYVQTRFATSGGHVLRIWENGSPVSERTFPMVRGCIPYYLQLARLWRRELKNFVRSRGETTAIFTHPLFAACGAPRGVKRFFWQWDHFPDRSLKSRIFNAFAHAFAPKCDAYRPLTHAIGAAAGIPAAPSMMLGVRPPEVFGSPSSTRLLMVGQLRKGQGVEDVLRFLASNPEYSLFLAGAPAEGFGDELKSLARELGVENRMTFAGRFLSQEELAAEARNCLAALALYDVSPDNFTHFADPGKVKFCIELGLPVVMTRISEIAPFIEETGAGEVIDSPAGLSAALSRIRASAAEYHAGCTRFARLFDWRERYTPFFETLTRPPLA